MIARAYGLVVAPIANLRAHPDHRAELKSQRWHGEVLEVRAQVGLWFKAAGWDGYAGWVRFSSLRLLGRRAARAWERAAAALTWGSGGVVVRERASARAPALALLPWGARVEPVAARGAFVRVRLADGRFGAVPAGELQTPSAGRRRHDPGRRAAELALAVRGAAYLWGGTTSWGFDCSGLVQWAYALAGRALPRDARDQIEVTRPVAAGERARPGDLLFFGGGGEVGHVALVTRPPRFVHAYSRVEEGTLGSGPGARPELRAACLGLRRPQVNASYRPRPADH